MTPDKLPLPPSWLLDAQGQRSERSTSEPIAANEIREGSRNDTLTRLAGAMRRNGMSKGEILAALRAANQERCRPALDDDEVEKIASSVSRYEPDQLTQAMIEGWAQADFAATDDESEDSDAKSPGEFPIAFCEELPGVMGEIIKWNLSTAFMPQPILALAGAIALFSVITGRKITDCQGSRTNTYVVCIAPSGAGKEHARRVNKAVLSGANMELRIAESIASGTGLVNAVDAQSEILFQIDEIGRFLQTVGNPTTSTHLYQIVTVMLKMFTSSNSLYVGDVFADTKKIKRIEQPHLCLFGSTVSQSFFDSLTTESLTDGFIGRLLVFEAGESADVDSDDDRDIADFTPPKIITDTAAWWRDHKPWPLVKSNCPLPRKLVDSAGAKSIFKELKSTARDPTAGSIESAIWVRAHEKARKLALLYSVAEHCEAEEISPDAAEWGCAVVRHLTRRLVYLAGRHVADGAFDKTTLKVLRIIEDAGRDGITGRKLCWSTRGIKPRDRDEILNGLRQGGRIAQLDDNKSGSGRKRIVFLASRFARAMQQMQQIGNE